MIRLGSAGHNDDNVVRRLAEADPVSVHGDLDSLLSAPTRANEVVVVDSGMGVADVDALIGGSSWEHFHASEYPVSIAVVLDARPERVYEASMPHLGRPSTGLDLRSPPGSGLAGSALFWLLEPR